MLKIQFIECIVLSLYGLLVAVRFEKNRSLYEKLTVVILMLCQLHTIIALLINGTEIKTYLTEILFVIVITAICVYKRVEGVKVRAVISVIFRVCGAAVYIGCFIYLIYSVNLIQKCFDTIASGNEEVYVIKSAVDESLVITADIQDGAEGSHLYYSNYTGSNNQKFELLNVGQNQYKILLAGTTQAFDLSNGDMDEGTTVNCWEMYDTPTQLWEIEEESKYIVITSVHSGLTIANRFTQGNDICVYGKTGALDEKYILSRTISEQQITQAVADYSDNRIFHVSVYYVYVVILCIATISIVAYSVKRNNCEKVSC